MEETFHSQDCEITEEYLPEESIKLILGGTCSGWEIKIEIVYGISKFTSFFFFFFWT